MAQIRGHVVERLDGDEAWQIIDGLAEKYPGQPYPERPDRVVSLSGGPPVSHRIRLRPLANQAVADDTVRVTTFASVSPVLPTRDVRGALERYQRLGFEVSTYDGGEFYGYARRGDVWLHLSKVDDLDPLTSMVSVYLYVGDADAVHTEWSSSGVDGRFHEPSDTDYGLREGAYIDPDGNLLRYGSWLDRREA